MNSRIINLLVNNPNFYTKEDISKIFNLSSTSFSKHLEAINKLGYNIDFSPYGFIVSFPEYNNDISDNISEKELEKLKVFEFIKEILVFDREISINAFKGTEIEDTINKMIGDRYLLLDDGILHLPTDLLENLSDEPLLKLLIILNVLRKYHHYGSVLNNIYYKASAKYVERGYSFDPRIIVYGQRASSSTLSAEISLEVIDAIENNNTISFKYKSNSNLKASKETVIPALLIYSGIRKSWYLISTQKNVYRLDRIEGQIELKEKYLLPEIDVEPYKNALIISNEALVEVEIHFTNKDYIKKRLIRYSKNRNQSQIIENKDGLILKDVVNGILEITPFIKSFGATAKVEKSLKLKNAINRDNKLLLERYGDFNA